MSTDALLSRRGSRASRVLPGLALLAVAVVAALDAVTAAAQTEPVKFSLRLAPGAPAIAPGSTFRVELTAKMDEGWHLYSTTQPPGGPITTRITVSKGQAVTLAGKIEVPKPKVVFDQNFGIDTELYDREATFVIPLQLAADAKPGALKIAVDTYFQACNDKFCLPPKTVKTEVEITVAGTVTAAAPAVASAAPAPSAVPDGPIDRSQTLWSFLWLAMSMGALALLTPCVFPMVPITVSYFTSHSAGRRGAAVRKAFIYSAGIVMTFTALGLALALVLGATSLNQFAASPWINLLITAIFLAFAVNLFGAFELQLPAGLTTRLDALTRREGGSEVLGTLLMGLTFTLTSFTCTVPFVGTLLVMAAQGDWAWPLAGMLAFSTVFALPFFVLALAPQIASQLPRSGGWLNAVKVLMGFLEVAAAMKFISNVDLVWQWGFFTREVVLATWVGIGVLMAMYVLGMFRLSHDTAVEHVGAGRLATALVCLTLTAWLLTGLFGKRLGELDAFLPPAVYPGGAAAADADDGSGGRATAGEPAWILNDYGAALARAQSERKRVFVDFTGYTCTNCRWMEANMFPREDVRRELDRFVRVRLYTDGDGELFQRQQQMQQERFKTVALPYYAVLEADGSTVATFPGLTRDPSEFVKFLQQAQSAPPHM